MSRKFLSSIEDIILDAKSGKMFILVDDEDRENEGDLVIPAQNCDHEKVNFMARFGRGLICLAMKEERVKELGLHLMSFDNQSRHKTAFTVSIEARYGITTGISAYDRAKTIADAIDKNKGREDIVTPGHIFPLQARAGGVLVRAGHTEAAVDISEIAGLNPSAVICEIMNDDGTMARINDLIKFAKQHDIKIGAISDLIEYRRVKEALVFAKHKAKFNSAIGGEFDLIIYQSKVDQSEHIALVKGDIKSDSPTLVRMHHLNIFNDCLDDVTNKKTGFLDRSLKVINENGSGVIVIIRQISESLTNLIGASKPKNEVQLKNYGIGAQILLDLGVKKINLLASREKSIIGIEGYGLEICNTILLKK